MQKNDIVTLVHNAYVLAVDVENLIDLFTYEELLSIVSLVSLI